MQGPRTSLFDAQVILEYRSADGPEVTQVRGAVLATAMRHLKESALYEQYLRGLPEARRDALVYAVAASWIPVEDALAHCHAIDALGVSERAIEEHGEAIAKDLASTVFATVVRSTLSVTGPSKGWVLLKQADRLMQRLYSGGGCTVIQTGPKDAVFEVHGLPLLTSRYFRASHHAWLRGLTKVAIGGSFAKGVRPRDPHPHTAATSLSWV